MATEKRIPLSRLQDSILKLTCISLRALPTLILLLSTFQQTCGTAGNCWLRVASNGRCQQLYSMPISKEDCCRSGVASMGWTPHANVSSGQMFYWTAIAGGAPDCEPCRVSCEGVECPANKRCRMRNGRPRCVCAPDCAQAGNRPRGHVCGLDGNTYRNYCAMLKHNCRNNKYVAVEYYGRCKQSCENVTCASVGERCMLDQDGLPHCVRCITHCPGVRNQRHICGVDGVTYRSLCHFRRATCLNGRAIGLAYMGRCRENAECTESTCLWGQRCFMLARTGQPVCLACQDVCSQSGRRICGSDNNTYRSWCHMRHRACQSGVYIETLHPGHCRNNTSTPSRNES